eukprot:10913357-Lingulodinium_polyedra.AAC.1
MALGGGRRAGRKHEPHPGTGRNARAYCPPPPAVAAAPAAQHASRQYAKTIPAPDRRAHAG